MIATFVLGLSGSGKTDYVEKNLEYFEHLDIEDQWAWADQKFPNMNMWRKAELVKLRFAAAVGMAFGQDLAIEITGQTIVSQDAVLAIGTALMEGGYSIEVVNLHPKNIQRFLAKADAQAKAFYEKFLKFDENKFRKPEDAGWGWPIQNIQTFTEE